PPKQPRHYVPPTWPHGTPEQLRAALAPVRPMMRQVRAAMRLEWRAHPVLHANDSASRMPFMAGYRECARDFVAESELARSQGQYDIAIQSSLDAMELGSKMSTGAGLMPRLVG